MRAPRLGRSFDGFDRRVWILFYGRIVQATGFAMALPFVALYLNGQLGVSMTEVGLVLLLSSAIGATGNIVGGEIADKFGRKRIMGLALTGRAVMMVLIAAVIAFLSGYLIIAVMITVSSFMGSMFEPASNAMVADIVPANRRLDAYGLLRIGANLGWALGPMIGGLLAVFSFSFLFLLGGIATGVVASFLMLMLSESMVPGESHERYRLRDMVKITQNRQFAAFCFISLFLFIMFGQMSSTFAVYSEKQVHISLAEVGYLYAINGLLVVCLQFPIARVISHYRMCSVIAMGSLFYAIGYGLVGLAPDFLFLSICMLVVTMGEMVVSPSSMNLVANMSPENERGRYMGFYGLFSSYGFAAGPFVGGVLMDILIGSPVLLWMSIGMFGVVAMVGYLLLGRRMSDSLNCSKAI
ncbi:MAG TPA: MFS transporter [Methanomassiliicoccales archaeon]|jgi:MFS family permease